MSDDRFGQFYISLDCEACEEEIIHGPAITTITHDGLPVIPLTLGVQSTFRCEHCDAVNYTGDFEVYCDD